jgi:hypothetical protein
LEYRVGGSKLTSGLEVEEKMRRTIRNASEIVLFVVLSIAVTGTWACLWLLPQ